MAEIRRSAAYRIAFIYSAALALAIALLGAAVYVAADAAFRGQQDAAIVEESGDLAQSYRQEGLAELREEIAVRERAGRVDSFGYAVFDAQGRRVAGSLDTVATPAGWHDIAFRDPIEGPDPARALTTPLARDLRLLVASDNEAIERIDATILTLFGGALVLVLLLGTGGALLLGAYLRRRLARISGTAQAIVGGDLAQRIPVGTRGDEFDQLAHSLNAMLDRIAQLLDNLRQVSSDVAHDLRTPLARLRGEIETALDGSADPPRQRTALKNALRRSDDLLSLFAAILRISEVEGGNAGAARASIDLSVLTADLCDTYAPAVADGGRTLASDIAPGALVSGDRELLAQALINLLDNAQLHTPVGTAIAVALHCTEGGVTLTVADDGNGVAETDRDRMVRRFVRLDPSRTRPGNGLGLNMVAAIITAYGGTLAITDNEPGLCVTIRLPRVLA